MVNITVIVTDGNMDSVYNLIEQLQQENAKFVVKHDGIGKAIYYCPKCYEVIDEQDGYCRYCGQKIRY